MCLQKCDAVSLAELRDSFSRVNVLRIHAADLDELVKEFGARDFYRKLGIMARDVISIRRLQVVLLKMALILGAKVYPDSNVEGLNPSDPKSHYWTANVSTPHADLASFEFNIFIIASGERAELATSLGFSRTFFRAATAIGVTCNFALPSDAERRVKTAATCVEGGRVSYLNAPFFRTLAEQGLELENFASYVTDESHYIVFTPKKHTLLDRHVLKEDDPDPAHIVRSANVDRTNLESLARQVATAVGVPEDCGFLEWRSRKDPTHVWRDVAIFDFTTKSTAAVASRLVTEPNGKTLLMACVGDALINPVWPQGTGWARATASCASLNLAVRDLGPPDVWCERGEAVLAEHEARYVKLKSETYAT
ncbi:[F-actin]-monooxygenase mical1 [Borealophlyctis nickersoniae]|nr:[F-actin]-monooxygenase mical1 [Borealophlyctis nickersoniae]